ncbi:tetraacyldisaccharide 4'-kinase, partial [Bacteriovoracaceae bacterium]|nr:tetraacyldisaccharide 4'-kinase [Bacteriovoracaceae bacterium]
MKINYLKLLDLKGIKKLMLLPFSLLWDFLHHLRRILYEYGFLQREYFRVPIISVGNLSFGGTGKTPVILWLIEYLSELNQKVVILSRGFKGELENSVGIIRGGQRFRSNPYEFGDEAILIAKRIKQGALIVGKKRSENLKNYFHEVQPDVVLLDDGFQHLKLNRSSNIVLFDATMPLEHYYTAPLGYLREGMHTLKYADMIIISRVNQVGKVELKNMIKHISQFKSRDTPLILIQYILTGLKDCMDQQIFKPEELKGKKIIAFSAIGSPKSFHDSLKEYGCIITHEVAREDHHYFNLEEIGKISNLARKENAIVVVTEKDMVKIKRLTQDPIFLYASIQIEFLNGIEV